MREWKDKDLNTPSHDEIMLALMDKRLWEILLTKHKLLPNDVKITRVEAEKPIDTENGMPSRFNKIIGFADFCIRFPTNESPNGFLLIYCEIKATEPSFGNVVRQVKKYRVYTHGLCRWLVISPYKEWEKPLLSQGIYWISSNEVLEEAKKLKETQVKSGQESEVM